MEKRLFFQAAMAGLGKYYMGGYVASPLVLSWTRAVDLSHMGLPGPLVKGGGGMTTSDVLGY